MEAIRSSENLPPTRLATQRRNTKLEGMLGCVGEVLAFPAAGCSADISVCPPLSSPVTKQNFVYAKNKAVRIGS
jgi:hypothetical protein